MREQLYNRKQFVQSLNQSLYVRVNESETNVAICELFSIYLKPWDEREK